MVLFVNAFLFVIIISKIPAVDEISKFETKIDLEISVEFMLTEPFTKYLKMIPAARNTIEKKEKNAMGKRFFVFMDFSSIVNFNCKYQAITRNGTAKKGNSITRFSKMISDSCMFFRINLLAMLPQIP